MTIETLEKENKIIKKVKFDKEKFLKEMFLTDEEIKAKLDEHDEYYKTHKFVWTPVKESYLNWIKRLNFKYELWS